jgi:hypothetical protein
LQVEEFEAESKDQECRQESITLSGPRSSFDEMASWYTKFANKLQVQQFEAQSKVRECSQDNITLSCPTTSKSVSLWIGKIRDTKNHQGS